MFILYIILCYHKYIAFCPLKFLLAKHNFPTHKLNDCLSYKNFYQRNQNEKYMKKT